MTRKLALILLAVLFAFVIFSYTALTAPDIVNVTSTTGAQSVLGK